MSERDVRPSAEWGCILEPNGLLNCILDLLRGMEKWLSKTLRIVGNLTNIQTHHKSRSVAVVQHKHYS